MWLWRGRMVDNIIKEINCGGYLSLSLIDDWTAKYMTL